MTFLHLDFEEKLDLESFPFTLTPDDFSLAHLNQVDLMLSAEGLHQLDVHGLVAVGCKGAKMGLTPATEH